MRIPQVTEIKKSSVDVNSEAEGRCSRSGGCTDIGLFVGRVFQHQDDTIVLEKNVWAVL